MSFRFPGFMRESGRMAAALGLFAALALSGCGGSEGGSGDFGQKFEPPAATEGAKSAPPVAAEKPKSRREMIEEDREASQKKKGKSR